MKIHDWHRERISADPEYARAAELVNLTESLADIVVALRIQVGLSQAELASLARTTQATISSIETGGANPRADTVSKIIAALLSHAASPSATPVDIDFGSADAAFRPLYSFDSDLLATASGDVSALGVNRVCWQEAVGPSPVSCAA